MASSGTGKALIIVGSILGILSVFLYFISEPLGSWWTVTIDPLIGSDTHNYMNIFGQFQDQESFNPEDLTLGFYGILAAVLVIVGSILGFITLGNQSKVIGILGALIIIGGIIIFLIGLNNVEGFQDIISGLEFFSDEEYNVFFGSASFINDWTWYLSAGFFFAVIAAILLLIGSFMLD
jgi:hypothetical protein